MINDITQSQYRLSLLNEQQERISYQNSTKKKIDDGSDDSVVFAKEIFLEDKMSTFEGLKKLITRTEAQNTTADTSIAGIKKLLDKIKVEVSKALNGTSTVESKKAIAIELDGIKQSLLKFANENSNDEYLFAGSDSGKKPFEQDVLTGKVTYVGNGYLKKVAVDENSYRDRGVTGFDMMAINRNTAVVGQNLTFIANERIVDEQGNEWKLNPAIPELVKNDEFGATSDTLALNEVLPATTPKTYETAAPLATPGQVLKSKESIFDILDNTINALNQVDSTGAPVTESVATAALTKGQADFNTAFDSVNSAHAQLGVRNKIFELSLETINSKLTNFRVLYEKNSSVDLASVALESKALELTFTALYSTVNKMNQLSLVNFIK